MRHDSLSNPSLENKPEAKSFMRTALAWSGSVTPVVLPRVGIVALYASAILALLSFFPELTIPITPFEYSGAVLGLLLVLRVNSGIDRWWEARKIWGSIVNQSRNLALIGYGYTKAKTQTTKNFLRVVAAWPYVMKQSLRGSRDLSDLKSILPVDVVEHIRQSQHMPTYIGFKITELLSELRTLGLDNFAFQRADSERSLLIDAIGASERIKNTRMPLALAIKTRRFILLFLILLPFALGERLGLMMPFVVALVAYPLLSLDEIGAELQNPFSNKNLSHLPLDGICKTIADNVLSLETATAPSLSQAPLPEENSELFSDEPIRLSLKLSNI